MLRPRQLAFALPHDESFAREDFLEGPSNRAALALIESWPDWPARTIALVGPHGSGKSHLASIWAERTGARFLSARALDIDNLPPALATGALVLEDIAIAETDERTLFQLLNLAREDDAFLLLTAPTAPVGWTTRIRYLGSRLRAVPAVALDAPDDSLLRSVLVKLF
ncbi:MAG: chromosomal replication initiator DnaA, partial [Pseudorhodoplanes sp.]